MSDWHDYYELIGGTAATLLGLLFVSISLNAEMILGGGQRRLRRIAEQAFQNYLAVIVVALLVIFPGMSAQSLGYSLMGMASSGMAWVLYRAFQSVQSAASWHRHYLTGRRYLWSIAGYVCILYAGERIAAGARAEVTGWLAAATIVLVISATVVSWDLLVEVAEAKYAARDAGAPQDKLRNG